MITRTSGRTYYLLFIALAIWGGCAIAVWRPLIWPDFNAQIMNDGDTPLYVSYAVNLATCPFSVSHGVMTNAIGLNCQLPILGQVMNHYLDHPPGMVWLLSIFAVHSDQPIAIARMIECVLSAGMLLLCALIAARALSTAAAVGVLLSSALVPLFWFHAVAINLNQAALFFSVLTVGALMEHQRSRNARWLALSLAAFAWGGVTDWPTFFIAGPIFLWLVYLRQWRAALAFLIVGVATLCGILVWFDGLVNNIGHPFKVLQFFKAVFVNQHDFRNAPHLMPIHQALMTSFVVMGSVMSVGLALLLFPVVAVFNPRLRARYAPLGLFFACFLTQGVLNQILFHQWAATHNYWTYYYLPAIFMSGGLLLDALWLWGGGLHRWVFWVLLSLVVVCCLRFAYQKNKSWRPAYATPPVSQLDYLKARKLDGMLAPGAVLLARDQEPFFGQGAKLRLVFGQPLRPIESAASLGCDNVYTVYKNASLSAADRAAMPKGTVLELYDWYVIPRNYLNPACR